jgi:pimeloyl-ACP methyl ester carboxylesterase
VEFLELDGARLEFRLWPGSGRTGLVLLHEGLGSVSMWRDFPDQLRAASGLSVFAWSRRGYGGSSPAPQPWPVGYMHEEARRNLAPVLEATGFEQFVLIGHSDGASIAAIHAGERPQPGLRGLVLMAPHFFVEDVSVASIAAARLAFETGDLRPRLERHHGANVDGAFWGWNRIWLDPAFRGWDITGFLPAITCPVLAIQGHDDQYGTMRQLDLVEDGVAGPFTRLELDDCRHSPHLDRPTATLGAVVDFLDTVA